MLECYNPEVLVGTDTQIVQGSSEVLKPVLNEREIRSVIQGLGRGAKREPIA
jgi:hypothetical protein